VVVFSGGGTGGHLYPALALADALMAAQPSVRAFFVGAERGLEARVLPERGLDHLLLPVHGIDRRSPTSFLRASLGLARALPRVGGAFLDLRPELVVVTGGYAAAPAGLAAWLMGIPLVIQEANSVPGVTTRLLAGFADRILMGFPEASRALPRRIAARVRYSGNPVAPPFALDRAEARRSLGIPTHGPLVLVVGGSQGSAALNEATLEAIAIGVSSGRPWAEGVHLLWSTGPTHIERIQAALGELGSPAWVTPVGYIDEMPLALASCDLAVSRAGAMATSELLAWGVPSVLVPLPTAAADHQTHNARALVDVGAAAFVDERDLTGATLVHALRDLLSDPRALAAMKASASAVSHPAAAREIATELGGYLGGGFER
jgi:UDP-N-acetylglucosamine--N-acetylmuramyl-(pentapeptide) pyrophosphoryl-undecaprenol N-acetylglucosamine transferase